MRHILLDLESAEIAPKTEALLFAADRAEHMARVIHPAFSRGEMVISDRYVDSFIAYENGGRQLLSEDILPISRWATDSLKPPLTILLDIAPQAGLSRRRELDRMESQPIDFHERVRATFLELASRAPDRYLVVDAEQTSEAISTIVKAKCAVFLDTK